MLSSCLSFPAELQGTIESLKAKLGGGHPFPWSICSLVFLTDSPVAAAPNGASSEAGKASSAGLSRMPTCSMLMTSLSGRVSELEDDVARLQAGMGQVNCNCSNPLINRESVSGVE